MARLLLFFLLMALLAAAVAGPLAIRRTSRSPSDDDGDDEDDPDDPDSVLLALDMDTKRNLARLMSRGGNRAEMRAIVRRTLDMFDRQPDRACANVQTRQHYNDSAKVLGRILTGDARFGSTTSESEASQKQSEDSDFCPDNATRPNARGLSIASMKVCLRLRSNGRSHAAIRKLYPHYDPDKIAYYRKCLEEGEPLIEKIKRLNKGVLDRVREAREGGLPVHGRTMRRWGLELADELEIPRDVFSASPTWLYKLKKTGRIGSRKVTEYMSRSEHDQQDELDDRIETFLAQYDHFSPRHRRGLIINVDQTPFNYEIANLRTLSFVGERDTRLRIDQRNKVTHSFTSQPMITRDGRTLGRLLLVFQEPSGSFGPIVTSTVNDLETLFGNVRVFASKSGKLSTALFQRWIREVLSPAVGGQLRSIDTDTDLGSDIEAMSLDDEVFDDPNPRVSTPLRSPLCTPVNGTCLRTNYRAPHTLLIGDSWTGQTNDEAQADLRRRGIRFLQIPKQTTKYIQPLDVYFNLQYKRFAKEIAEAAIDPRSDIRYTELISREGHIKQHAIMWNQFGSPLYEDMLRYAWHNTDPHFSLDEMQSQPKPRGVVDIQFNLNRTTCSHVESPGSSCQRPAFIKCSHCGKVLCLKHFLQPVCFHDVSDQGPKPGPSGSASSQQTIEYGPDDPYWGDDDFTGNDLFNHSKTSTRKPRGQ